MQSITPIIRLLLLIFVLAGQALAQEAPASAVFAERKAQLQELSARVEKLRSDIDAKKSDDLALADIRLKMEDLARELIRTAAGLGPRLTEINARIQQIGDLPSENLPQEMEALAAEKAALLREKAEINALIGDAESQSIALNRDMDRITTIRRDLFLNQLSKRVPIDLTLAGEAFSAFQTEIAETSKRVRSAITFMLRTKLNSFLIATGLALLIAVVLFVGGRRLFGRLLERSAELQHPSYLSRVSVAFWSSVLPMMALTVFVIGALVLYRNYSILRPDIGEMAAGLAGAVLIVFLVQRLASAVLCPDMPAWRLLSVETVPARRLYWIVLAIAVISGIDHFLSRVGEVMDSPLMLTVAKSIVASVLVGSLIFIIGLLKPLRDENGARRPWPLIIRLPLFVIGLVPILAVLFGYIGFARFFLAQIVVTVPIAVMMYIGFLSAQAVSEEQALAATAVGRRLRKTRGFDESTLDQIGLGLSVLLYVGVLAIGIPLLLLQWGFSLTDIWGWTWRYATEIRIGSFSFSLTGVLAGIVVLVIGYFVTRWFQGWLDNRVMARGKVDAGVRNSISTAVGYAGIVVAVLVGISVAGIDLSNFALIAGALSLGIGFGLQNIVSNFVSGLILLAERPFKAGDWVVAGPVQGTVKKISVRATEIETFQRQTIILPNSELINSAVGNWTHKNKLGRVDVRVGVGYDSDPRQVQQILLELARSHTLIAKNPEPHVHFMDFGDSALMFELRFFLYDITNSVVVQNDIRFAIVDRFKAEGIQIPFPQRELRVRREDAALLSAIEAVEEPPRVESRDGGTVRKRRGRRKPDPDTDGEET